jgi:hypothetical protein
MQNLPLVLVVIHLKTKHWKYQFPMKDYTWFGIMHFYFLSLDSLFFKKKIENFQFQYIHGQKALKSYP